MMDAPILEGGWAAVGGAEEEDGVGRGGAGPGEASGGRRVSGGRPSAHLSGHSPFGEGRQERSVSPNVRLYLAD